jgi:hypothetical protein
VRRALATTALATLAGAAPAAGAPPVAKVWTLRSLGHRDQFFGATSRQFSYRDVEFTLPRGAHQGPNSWYLIRLHFRISISPDSGPGRIYIVASTNDRPAAMIRFDTTASRAGVRVRSSELGLVNGARSATGLPLVVESRFENFLEYKGVRAGKNTLTFKVEQYDGARIRSLRVFGDSGIEFSRLGPATLRLEPFLSRRALEVGSTFDVGFRVHNDGERPSVGGTVTLLVGEGLRRRGPRTWPLGTIRPEGEEQGKLTLEARRPGRFDVMLASQTVFGSRLARLQVEVHPASQRSRGWIIAGGAALAALFLSAKAWFLIRRRIR